MAPAEHPHSSKGETSDHTSRANKWTARSPRAELLTLLELTDWAYFSLDSHGRFVEVSDRLAHLLSTTTDTLIGTTLASLVIPPHEKLLAEQLLPMGAKHPCQMRADRLRIVLSLRSFPYSGDPNHTAVEDLTASPDSVAHASGPYSLLSEDQPTIPAELVVNIKPEGVSHAQDARVAAIGLLRPLVTAAPSTARDDQEKPLLATGIQEPAQQQLRVILMFGQRVASAEDLDTLLVHLLRSLNRDLHYHYADIFFLSDDGRCAILRASSTGGHKTHATSSTDAGGGAQFRISEQGILGQVVGSNSPVVINHMADHPNDELLRDRPKVKSMLAVPVALNGGVTGVLAVQSEAPDAFTLDDVVLLQILADQASIAIEYTSLLNERDQRLAELSALNQIGMLLASPGRLLDTLDAIIRHVSALFQVEAASLVLAEDGKLSFKVAAGTHIDRIQPYTLKIGQGIAGWAVQNNQTVRVNDVAADPRHYAGMDETISFDTRSLIAAPLRIAKRSGDISRGIGDERVIGVIEIINRLDGRPFTRNDEVLIEFIASSAAVVIENVRLFNQLEQRFSEVSALQRETQHRVEAQTALGSASEAINRALKLDEVLQTAVEAAAALMPSSQGVALMLREEETSDLRVAAHRGFEEATLDAISLLKIDQANCRGVGSISDLMVSEFPTHSARDSMPLIGIPLRGQEDVIGLIVVGAALKSNETRRLLQTLGDMVAIAIEKARLHEATTRRLAEVSTLYTLANQITTVLDLNRILETTVTIIHHALDCQGCCLHLHNPQTGDLTLKASSGRGRREYETADLQIISLISRQVLRKRQPVNLTHIKSAPTASKPSSGGSLNNVLAPPDIASSGHEWDTSIQSLLIVPLITQNTPIGTLSIDDQSAEAFGPNEGRLLTIAAAQVAAAIENARLLRNLSNRAMQLEQAIEELRELHRLKTELIQNVSHELRTPLTFVKSYVQLILEGAMGKINSDLRDTLTIVDGRTDAIIRLVNDVISLEQVEMGQFEFQPITLAEVAFRSVEGAAMTARESGVNIELQVADDLPTVHADPGRLGQVFDNLLGNAIKFSPAASNITVRVWHDGAFVRADVEDQGIGIPAARLERIFDRFYQVDGSTTRRFGGTGLGLAIVKTIVESHGGHVTVESKVGVGSIFSFALPIPTKTG